MIEVILRKDLLLTTCVYSIDVINIISGVLLWCEQELGYRPKICHALYKHYRFGFQCEEDAMAFKLRWS